MSSFYKAEKDGDQEQVKACIFLNLHNHDPEPFYSAYTMLLSHSYSMRKMPKYF